VRVWTVVGQGFLVVIEVVRVVRVKERREGRVWFFRAERRHE